MRAYSLACVLIDRDGCVLSVGGSVAMRAGALPCVLWRCRVCCVVIMRAGALPCVLGRWDVC